MNIKELFTRLERARRHSLGRRATRQRGCGRRAKQEVSSVEIHFLFLI